MSEIRCPLCGSVTWDGCTCDSLDPVKARIASDKIAAEITALAAGSRRAKTPTAVECEASQSGPKGNAQSLVSNPIRRGGVNSRL
jgi:hypothetical protein